jgi:hypothetical protein
VRIRYSALALLRFLGFSGILHLLTAVAFSSILFFKNHAGSGQIFITKRCELLRSYCNGALWHFAILRNFTKDSAFIIKIAKFFSEFDSVNACTKFSHAEN